MSFNYAQPMTLLSPASRCLPETQHVCNHIKQKNSLNRASLCARFRGLHRRQGRFSFTVWHSLQGFSAKRDLVNWQWMMSWGKWDQHGVYASTTLTSPQVMRYGSRLLRVSTPRVSPWCWSSQPLGYFSTITKNHLPTARGIPQGGKSFFCFSTGMNY